MEWDGDKQDEAGDEGPLGPLPPDLLNALGEGSRRTEESPIVNLSLDLQPWRHRNTRNNGCRIVARARIHLKRYQTNGMRRQRTCSA